MKKTILCILLCVSCIGIFGQTTFTDLIKTIKKTFGTSVFLAANGDYFVPLVNADSGLYISRINNNGKVLWEKIYDGHNSSTSPTTIRSTKENNFLIFTSLFNQRLN